MVEAERSGNVGAGDGHGEKERKKALLTKGDRKIKKDTHLQHFEVS